MNAIEHGLAIAEESPVVLQAENPGLLRNFLIRHHGAQPVHWNSVLYCGNYIHLEFGSPAEDGTEADNPSTGCGWGDLPILFVERNLYGY